MKSNEIEEFQEYLKIDTRQPTPDYLKAIEFLNGKCRSLNADHIEIKEYVQGKPILIATFQGSDKSLKSLFLNSHMDVVPTVDSCWTTDHPLSATIENGKIYARGSQDMKCIGMAYLHALQRIRSEGLALKRTIHVCFVPDEEIGGTDGMGRLVEDADLMRYLNIGVAVDEGAPGPATDGPFYLFKQERSKLWYHLTIQGSAGHGSLLMQGTAAEKLTQALTQIDKIRQEQLRKLVESKGRLGNVTSLNVTMISSSSDQVNVIPSVYKVDMDVRIGPDYYSNDVGEQFTAKLGNTIESIPGCSIEIKHSMDTLKDISEHNEFENMIRELFDIQVEVFPGGTDARYLRQKKIPAFGMTLFRGMPILLHDHDEYMPVDAYIAGIDNYFQLIRRFCC